MFRRYAFRDFIYLLKSRHFKFSTHKGPRKKKKFKLKLFILLFMILLAWLVVMFETRIQPTVKEMAEFRAKSIALQTINDAVSKEIVKVVKYEDIVTLKKDENSEIIAFQTDVFKMNQIQTNTSQLAYKKLNKVQVSDLKIPLGSIFDSSILSGWGPRIPVRIVPIGTIQTQFVDDFSSAGINQTKHKIMLQIKGKMKVVAPLTRIYTSVVTSIPIAETVIVGDVPGTYLDVGDSSSEDKKKTGQNLIENFADN